MRVPPDDLLPHLLLEPRELNLQSRDGVLGRIVDVEKALAGRTYNEEGRVVLEIFDDMCPWNRGRWELETSGDETKVTKTSKAPEIEMPIDTLAMTFFGQISLTEAGRMGRLKVLKGDGPASFDGIFRTKYRPFCADYF